MTTPPLTPQDIAADRETIMTSDEDFSDQSTIPRYSAEIGGLKAEVERLQAENERLRGLLERSSSKLTFMMIKSDDDESAAGDLIAEIEAALAESPADDVKP
jgi:archaellum component FlaC